MQDVYADKPRSKRHWITTVQDSNDLLKRIADLEQSIDRLTAAILILIDNMEEQESEEEHYLDAL